MIKATGKRGILGKIAEWRNGCSCAPKHWPNECRECTMAMVRSVEDDACKVADEVAEMLQSSLRYTGMVRRESLHIARMIAATAEKISRTASHGADLAAVLASLKDAARKVRGIALEDPEVGP